ncbi:TerC family protein [Gallibacterium anatis]|uniref:Membrane protein n=1 Tax=Gallibacterium genomosp. 1 TaxID=155515 RepID=A0AB36DVV2_9PAST|nr:MULTISPECIES: TerC family protein [Gallibacterium]KGQ32672.1 membrane protein [Gallibacterium anatis]KGQ49857.1 membrane protein [Gallibacterium anatis]OBX00715.1 membrane protein [Gallibacterium genomosp. 1]OBX01094.1 membrane protein [Gallibacterium genomosp. 1]
MLEWISSPEAWVALFTLTALEIVLGIDNIIFISILVGRLPVHQRQSGRVLGLGLAMGTRILLLLSLAWIMRLTEPLFSVMGYAISGRDLILLIGGLFLLVKSTLEIHHNMEESASTEEKPVKTVNFIGVLIQIALLDIVFSLDSVITAVGMANDVEVMILAIILAVGVMMIAAKPIGDFVEEHPTLKILALSFLILIGVSLIGEGLSFHIPKGYIYFAMGFSVCVEMINLRMRKHLSQKG